MVRFSIRYSLFDVYRWVELDKVVLGSFFPIRLRFDGLCSWVEWDKALLGVFFLSGWELIDCLGWLSGI